MQKIHTFRPNGLWSVTGAAILWGTIGVATQGIYNVDDTSSLFINLTRMLIATPVLLIACRRVVGRGMFAIRRRDLGIMMLTGALLALSHAAYFAAIRATGVTIPTLLTICVAPVIVASASVLLKLERLTGRILLAMACALIGSALLVGAQSPQGVQGDLLLGTIFSLIAAVFYAGMIVGGRFLAADYHPLQVTAISFAAGTAVLIPINLIGGVVPVHSAEGWLLVLYLGLVPTALAYWLLQMGLRTVSATAASIIGMLDPLVAALLAWALFGETLAAAGIAGALLLILSIGVLSVRGRG